MKNRFIVSRRTLLNLFCSLLIVLHVLPLITSASASDSVCTAARAPSAEADASQDSSLVNILLIGQDRRTVPPEPTPSFSAVFSRRPAVLLLLPFFGICMWKFPDMKETV